MRHAKRQAMAQNAAKKEKQTKQRASPILRGAVTLTFLGLISFGGYQALVHPETPLPRAWNPTQPLRVSDPVTPITYWKLNRTASDGASCMAALDSAASWQPLADFEVSDQCHIRDRVDLRSVGLARMNTVETRCAIALRLAMWERHSLQPAAQAVFGADLTGIDHFGSYSCRTMRISAGRTARMSTHATADAIDIAGFRFSDGRSLRLIDDWTGDTSAARFLRAARDGACDWFNLTLSPDYNRLHADHFHLQSTGWGLCR